MTLGEIVSKIERLPNDLTIFVESGNIIGKDSRILLIPSAELGKSVQGYEYFLEIELAKEVLEVWSGWRDNRQPGETERIEAVVHYAKNDAYLEPKD